MPNTIGGLTLEQWQEEVATLTVARNNALRSQQHSVGDGVIARSNRRPDLEQIQAALKEARSNVEALEVAASGRRIVYGVPRR